MRLSRPSLLVLFAALIASLSIHLPVYEVLGVLARAFDSDKPQATASTSTIEFEVSPSEPSDQAPEAKKPEPKDQKANAKKPSEQQKQKEAEAKRNQPKPEEKKVELTPQPAVPVPPPPDMNKPIENKLAVTQKSEDPNVAPPDSRYIAEENRRVEEEMIASVRSLTENDDKPSASAPKRPNDDQQGNAEEDEPAELQNVQGEDKRIPSPREAKEKPLSPSQMGQGEESGEAVAHAPERGGSPSKDEARKEVAAGSEQVGGQDQMLVIQDGAGTIRVRKSAPGAGGGEQGGEAQKGGRAQAERAPGGRAGDGSNLKLSWSQFESTFGAEQLREQRDAYLEQHRSKSRGGQREEDWKKFRAAVENFVDRVKPGNQTALNAAASPFAAYLAEVHRSIHREFAMRFLRGLPLVGGAFADPSLVTRLEIVINQDGSLHQVGVIRTSGFTPFDYGAWNAVQKSAPYPQPPKKILSGDGRVYVRWDFYNNERQCGTFNAEPFILPNPGGDPKPPAGPFQDRGTIPPDGKLGLMPLRGADRLAQDDNHDEHAGHAHSHAP